MNVNALIGFGANEVFALPLEAVVKAGGQSFIFVLKKMKRNIKSSILNG